MLLCGPHISWPHISWPLVGQLQIMSQFLLVEKADDLNSELKRDYSNMGNTSFWLPATPIHSTQHPHLSGAQQHLIWVWRLKKLFCLEDKDEGRLNFCCLKPSAHPHFPTLDCGWCWLRFWNSSFISQKATFLVRKKVGRDANSNNCDSVQCVGSKYDQQESYLTTPKDTNNLQILMKII